jgi:hypothetical protein
METFATIGSEGLRALPSEQRLEPFSRGLAQVAPLDQLPAISVSWSTRYSQ